ncbi:MAG: S8 family serine peptidase [Myxococcota bacterium]
MTTRNGLASGLLLALGAALLFSLTKALIVSGDATDGSGHRSARSRDVEPGLRSREAALPGRRPSAHPVDREPHPGAESDPVDAPPNGALALAEIDGPESPSPEQLDRARPEIVRAVLGRAIDAARRERPLAIAPSIVEVAAREGEVRVIFETASIADPADLADRLETGGRPDSVDDLRLFPLLGHGAARLSAGALLNLIVETPTSSIEIDGVHHSSLLESVPQIGADVAHDASYDGDGFAVAIIDTGVDTDHPMFASRLIEEACFSRDHDCPNGASQMLGEGAAIPCAVSGCDHGTHVAGIALGDAESGPLVGVAPHAALIAINVFSDIDGEPGAYTSDILAAMQHVLALSAFYEIAAINLSLGGSAYSSHQSCNQASPSQLSAVGQLRNAGIATVAASGNESFTNAIASPGCLSNVISVGSVGGSDIVSSFSNTAEFLTLLAPGESILSAAVGGGTRNGGGTSMATPHVAGAIAAMREAMPGASVDEIENALVLAGEPIVDGRNGFTIPRVQLDAAITLLEAAGPPAGGGGAAPGAGAGGGGDGGGSASPSSGGGGGGCGLVGLEPFLILALVRGGRRLGLRP